MWPSPAVPATTVPLWETNPQCDSATEQRASAGSKTLCHIIVHHQSNKLF